MTSTLLDGHLAAEQARAILGQTGSRLRLDTHGWVRPLALTDHGTAIAECWVLWAKVPAKRVARISRLAPRPNVVAVVGGDAWPMWWLTRPLAAFAAETANGRIAAAIGGQREVADPHAALLPSVATAHVTVLDTPVSADPVDPADFVYPGPVRR